MRENFTPYFINVFARASQKKTDEFHGILSKNIDLSVTFEVDAMLDWLKRYYKLQKITITNYEIMRFCKGASSLQSSLLKTFQQINLKSIDSIDKNDIIDFNILSLNEDAPANKYSARIDVFGTLSDKQKEDIRQFIKLRAWSDVNIVFNAESASDIIVSLRFEATKQDAHADLVIDSQHNIFINGILSTDPLNAIYEVLTLEAMEKKTITGNGSTKTFTVTHTQDSSDIIAQARMQTTGQVVDIDVTVIDDNTLSVNTGSVAIANNVKVDILIAKQL
jgi:hypothetical protein